MCQLSSMNTASFLNNTGCGVCVKEYKNNSTTIFYDSGNLPATPGFLTLTKETRSFLSRAYMKKYKQTYNTGRSMFMYLFMYVQLVSFKNLCV